MTILAYIAIIIGAVLILGVGVIKWAAWYLTRDLPDEVRPEG